MIIDELCQKYAGNWGVATWLDVQLDDLLRDLPARGRTKAPRRLYAEGPYEKIDWLVHRCEPPFTLDAIDAYLTDCMQP